MTEPAPRPAISAGTHGRTWIPKSRQGRTTKAHGLINRWALEFGHSAWKSQRDFVPKPRVARHALPWVNGEGHHNPNGVATGAHEGKNHRNRSVPRRAGSLTQPNFKMCATI